MTSGQGTGKDGGGCGVYSLGLATQEERESSTQESHAFPPFPPLSTLISIEEWSLASVVVHDPVSFAFFLRSRAHRFNSRNNYTMHDGAERGR